MAKEERLEEILAKDIRIVSPNWMVIGRQVPTDYGTYIDLLCIDRDGHLVVIELKRDMTPREVVAQVLDYGSWVRTLKDEDIASIFEAYIQKYQPDGAKLSLDEAFKKSFPGQVLPDVLNESHELVVVASALDPSTERIVDYLANVHGVPINAVFFRVFQDEGREYLTRAWFIEPTTVDTATTVGEHEPWNGEYYVSFGQSEHRHWDDAVKYGFISAGHGLWFSGTLGLLEPGARIWVNDPGKGYLGVGRVTGHKVRVSEFMVTQDDGRSVPITELPVKAPHMFDDKDSDELSEYLVPVKWIKTQASNNPIKEKGFFGNQNTVCRPTTKKWVHTVDRLKKIWGIE